VNYSLLPTIDACFNLLSALLLLLGRRAIKGGKPERHQRLMVAALTSSALFLIGYLIYHAEVGSVPYPHHDWSRPVYLAILIPHSILAALMVPFILMAVWYAFRGRFDRHVRIVRWLWPVWMFVSVTGVIVYLMLYHT
jgi:putative membrane protein